QAFGGGAPAAQQPQQAAPQQQPQDAGGMAPGGAGSGAGVQSFPVSGEQGAGVPQQQQAAPPQQQASGAAPQGNVTPMNPLRIPAALAYTGYAADPGKYFETHASGYKTA